MFRSKIWDQGLKARPTGVAAAAVILLSALLAPQSGLAEAPFVFKHPVGNQSYDTLPIPLRISRNAGTLVSRSKAIDVLFEIRQWPHPYGFMVPVRNAIQPGQTDFETRLVYFWTTAPGTYSIRARADGFEDNPVEVTFTTTFTLDRPLYRVIKPDSKIYHGGNVPLVVGWDPFWTTVPHRPYGTLYAEVESWDEDNKTWQPEWKSKNLAGFQLPIVLPRQFSIPIQAPGKPTAKRVRVRPSFSRKAYTLPTGWRYFCHAPQGKVAVGPSGGSRPGVEQEQTDGSLGPEQNRKPCLGVSPEAGSAADLKGEVYPIPRPSTGTIRKQMN